MELEIKFECADCKQFAKQYMGTTGFVMPKIEYYDLTEAVNHIIETAHTIETKIVEK